MSERRILVVDDDEDFAGVVAEMAAFYGLKSKVVYSGGDALACLEEFRPDVVLLDLGMPGLDGCETARQIRVSPRGQSIKLVALTGWGRPEDIQRTQAAGFDHHLVKPNGLAGLKQILLGKCPSAHLS